VLRTYRPYTTIDSGIIDNLAIKYEFAITQKSDRNIPAMTPQAKTEN